MAKNLLCLCGRNDVCDEEQSVVNSVAKLVDVQISSKKLDPAKLQECFCDEKIKKWDYVYLDAHADRDGFGEQDGEDFVIWEDFAGAVCTADCLKQSAILFLACCRGGIKNTAWKLFANCTQIDFVCGPNWQIDSVTMATAFHTFLYNLECRREEPSVAARRASSAVGYKFLFYDRADWDEGSLTKVIHGDYEHEDQVNLVPKEPEICCPNPLVAPETTTTTANPDSAVPTTQLP